MRKIMNESSFNKITSPLESFFPSISVRRMEAANLTSSGQVSKDHIGHKVMASVFFGH